ncbi:hypothetical protein DICVIV_04210 [Dictyocaulus viviparus]|uniref:Uncharacterized protein n=1 Tax=Dictyocaulus viviparus TaxID=29172 RepID=A0A0D8Y0T5_DICVI|nr:hypothetical protein DICVIV_04210 [Dictyocaulus viviparus]
MHEVDPGPQCSLISYVVPPGLSRIPAIGPSDPIHCAVSSLETISAKNSRNGNRNIKRGATHYSSSPSQTVTETVSTQKETPAILPSTQSFGEAVKPPIKSYHTAAPDSHSQQQRKSCLSKNITTAAPARQTLKKKTVAFGKTVNVSQTIEGTSRLEKLAKLRNTMSKTKTLPEEPSCNLENKENEPQDSGKKVEEQTLLDILKDVKSSLDALKIRDEERAEELRSIREVVNERGKEIDLLRGMFADYIGKECPTSFESKESLSPRGTKFEGGGVDRNIDIDKVGKMNVDQPLRRTNQRHHTSPTTYSMKEKCEAENSDGESITFEEFRRLLTKNPRLRRFVADIRAEENDRYITYDDRHRYENAASSRWRGSPRQPERFMEAKVEHVKRDDLNQRGSRGAHKYTEKVTVERSVRCSPTELTQYSVDTRRYLEDQILDDNYEAIESTYRPGESVSYYPERIRRNRNAEDSPDSNEDVRGGRTYRDYPNTTVEERRKQRRIRRADLF